MEVFKLKWNFYATGAVLLNLLGFIIFINFSDFCHSPTFGTYVSSGIIDGGVAVGIFCLISLVVDLQKKKTKKSNIFSGNLIRKNLIKIIIVVIGIIFFLLLERMLFSPIASCTF